MTLTPEQRAVLTDYPPRFLDEGDEPPGVLGLLANARLDFYETRDKLFKITAERDAERQRKEHAIRAAELYKRARHELTSEMAIICEENADALFARAKGESNG